MKSRSIISQMARALTGAAQLTLVAIALATLAGCATSSRTASVAPAEFSGTSNRLSSLIDAQNYAAEDKEALKRGLSVAIPAVANNEMTVEHISQQTVDIQIKKLETNLLTSLTLISNVAQCLEDQANEF